ncbi:MAG: hypothetical protein LBT05_07875 [Planctomycetaceae bacterium]|jgi:hypothetical protein|nr:hypothetical protein [Planctomycetaceae bacterium]
MDYFYYQNKLSEILQSADLFHREKTAASRWKTELLKKATRWLDDFLKRRKNLPLGDPYYIRQAIGQNAAPHMDDAIYRDSLLRQIRGDAGAGLLDSVERQAVRGTVKHKVLGPAVPSVELPFDLDTTAWRGLNGGRWGKPRQEYLIGGRMYHSGKQDMPVYYGSRPEIAAEYANKRNMTMSPFWTPGQHFIGEFDLSQISPRLFNKYYSLHNKVLPAKPWTANYGEQSLKGRGPENQIKAFLRGRRDRGEYQITGLGHNVPYRRLYKMEASPVDISTISRPAGARLREARAQEKFIDFINGDTRLTPVELLEPTTAPMRRSRAFFERYSSPQALEKYRKSQRKQVVQEQQMQRLLQELQKRVTRWEKFESKPQSRSMPVTDWDVLDLSERYPEISHKITKDLLEKYRDVMY